MKKTYITSMPNHIGAFLKASKCFSELGINITRVSYNKAVDSHTLFIEAEGSEEQLKKADSKLKNIGYLQNTQLKSGIVLIEFALKDVPGSVTDVLMLIDEFNFNISYLSSQENGTDYQFFKMGLYVDDFEKISAFLQEAEKLCKVRVIDYNRSEKIYDNSIFYNAYVAGLSQMMNLDERVCEKLTVWVNLAMQTLDEEGLSPYRTFDSINKFAELLAASKKNEFSPRITNNKISENTEIILIEPPCGSNTAIIKSGNEVLFIDTGYACYTEEMTEIFKGILPEFEKMKKRVIVTHADVDHCGLLPIFDEIIVSAKSAECLTNEFKGQNGYREENYLHKPYINICKILTSYCLPNPEKLITPWRDFSNSGEPLVQIGFFDFGDMHFEVYEGAGGHLPGEIVLIDYKNCVAFTGDIYINLQGLTAQQAEYNKYAPTLMTSVDTDPVMCATERKAILQRLGKGNWQIFGAHGFKKDYFIK